MSLIPFDPPIDANVGCRNCGDPLVALGEVREIGAFSIGGLRQYEWTHAHGETACRPKTSAQPFDGWQATTSVETVRKARAAAEDALIDALADAGEQDTTNTN